MTSRDNSAIVESPSRNSARDAAQDVASKLATPPSGRALAVEWLAAFERALAGSGAAAFASLFHAQGYWRDFLALHWDLRTFSGSERIAAAWR